MTQHGNPHSPQGGIPVTAQLSVYPLRQADLGPAIEAVLEVLRAHGLPVQMGSMSTLTWGDDEAVFAALHEAFVAAAARGPAVLNMTVSNACPWPSSSQGGAPHGANLA
jgi:uncharacterized protein YqgV (UPF0045/DUF77 family)